ncbi:peptide-methionine (S)-S-oxide reductase [Herpetosiphon gulosus]|uniref:peptide-methionine (S)-S-oxide reductase n=1 Tax=Herpetosiphon gulosus TaxID=1973496 RepID=A0ABP9WW44_9CHLR
MNERIIVGAGCFWGIEAAFGELAGIVQTQAGYAGGLPICLLAARYVESVGFEILSH